MYKIFFKVKQEINGNITNGIRNPFRLNEENKAMKDKTIRDISLQAMQYFYSLSPQDAPFF